MSEKYFNKDENKITESFIKEVNFICNNKINEVYSLIPRIEEPYQDISFIKFGQK